MLILIINYGHWYVISYLSMIRVSWFIFYIYMIFCDSGPLLLRPVANFCNSVLLRQRPFATAAGNRCWLRRSGLLLSARKSAHGSFIAKMPARDNERCIKSFRWLYLTRRTWRGAPDVHDVHERGTNWHKPFALKQQTRVKSFLDTVKLTDSYSGIIFNVLITAIIKIL